MKSFRNFNGHYCYFLTFWFTLCTLQDYTGLSPLKFSLTILLTLAKKIERQGFMPFGGRNFNAGAHFPMFSSPYHHDQEYAKRWKIC